MERTYEQVRIEAGLARGQYLDERTENCGTMINLLTPKGLGQISECRRRYRRDRRSGE